MVTRDDPFRARDSWVRAGVFFVVCWVVAGASGALGRVLRDTGADRGGNWWIIALVTTAVVVNGYVNLWPRWTFHEDRPRVVPVQAAFGLVWGLSMGLLFVSVHELVASAGWSSTVTGLVAWLLVAGFQGSWHQLWWDLKVSPPHNVLRFNPVKVVTAHVPNVTLSMVVLVHWGDARFLVAMQVIALTASAVAMRFPPPGYVRDPSLDATLPAREAGEPVPA